MARICLITPGHVSFQPRTLREADALHEAGHDVRVVYREVDPDLSARDRRLMGRRKWRLSSVNVSGRGEARLPWLIEAVRSETYRRLFDMGIRTVGVAAKSYVRGLDRLKRAAVEEPAEWFIAHTQGALPVAAEGMRRWGARLGCDCEDLLAENGTDPPDVVRLLERTFLRQCAYVSVPSVSIAAELRRGLGIDPPLILYNTFPLALAGGLPAPRERRAVSPMRLHWFGQTLGPGRGLEEAVEALGYLGRGVELHLRGRVSDAYRSALLTLARRHGAASRIAFHPPVDHDDLIGTMGEFHVGLALERPGHGNYSRTVTNKLFGYLLAGLAVAATDTPGQREVMREIPSAGFLYPAGDAGALVERLHSWAQDPNALRAAQQAAWDAARRRYCWDVEKRRLLEVIESR